jgi:signal transduction histidine kinase
MQAGRGPSLDANEGTIRPVRQDDVIAKGVAEITARGTLGDSDVAPEVLRLLVADFCATGGRIYTLDLASGTYASAARESRTSTEADFDARRLRSGARSEWGPLEQAIYTRSPQVLAQPSSWSAGDGPHEYGSRVVLPVLRKNTVVGLVDLHAEQSDVFDARRGRCIEQAQTSMQQLANSLEARAVHRILERTAQFRVVLHKQQDVLVRNLVEFVGESSGMQYVVLRRLEGTTLRCVGSYGFDNAPTSAFHLFNIGDDYPTFAYVAETRDHWVAENIRDDIYQYIRSNTELSDVRSFVACPVLAGEDLWGVLSFAVAVEYEYSDLEVYALRALANLAGVALDAAQSAEDAAGTHYDDGRLMQAVLSNEVVIATRHEMYDQLEIVGTARSVLTEVLAPIADPKTSSRLTRKDIDLLLFQAKSLDTAHTQLNKVLETIRFTQTVGEQDRVRVSVLAAWERAREPFDYRISRARIQRLVSDLPSSLVVLGSVDWLRIVFMHLILNTLDAFDRDFQKGRREFGLKLSRQVNSLVQLRYYDNAGGIVPGTLHRWGVAVDVPPSQAIFDRYVTSKDKGTGLGLASCRAALDRMGGSIELVDWSKGVTFDLEIPAWQA